MRPDADLLGRSAEIYESSDRIKAVIDDAASEDEIETVLFFKVKIKIAEQIIDVLQSKYFLNNQAF